MADVGTSSLVAATPNASAMGVDASLDNLAAFLVNGQAAWVNHDGATLNSNLTAFWAAEAALDPGTTATYQNDITKLDAYSHRMLGFEYLYEMASADPSDLPTLVEEAEEQFNLSTTEFSASGNPSQASDDSLTLSQISGWGSQDASVWVDDSYVASVVATVNSDVSAASNLLSGASSAASSILSSLGSVGTFLGTTPGLIVAGAGALLLVYLFTRRR